MKAIRQNNTQAAMAARSTIAFGILLAVLIGCLPLLVACTSASGNANGGEIGDDGSVSEKTPYCELKYPEKWQSQMSIKETKDGELVSKHFYALLGDGEYALYTVHFGRTKKGEFFGYISGTPVYIECHSLTPENTLTEDEKLTYYLMMESINEVTQSIAADDNYSPS